MAEPLIVRLVRVALVLSLFVTPILMRRQYQPQVHQHTLLLAVIASINGLLLDQSPSKDKA